MLTAAETEARNIAARLVERTEYDPPEAAPGRVRDARLVARAVLELLQTVEAERGARQALQQRCETLQRIIGTKAYDSMLEPKT